MSTHDLTAQQLRERLHYDQATGVFTRLMKTANTVNVGDVAGHNSSNGYQRIGVKGKLFWAHRLAWLYVHGVWPTNDIDHIDGNGYNNAISNLRDIPHQANSQNVRKASRNNSHGFLGVMRNREKWAAQIEKQGTTYCLGTFKTPELAHQAYLDAKRKLHEGCTI